MFRLEENIPEIYTKSSRDFQLFCKIYNVLINSVRYNVKSTDYLLNPMLANDRILPLLATRVGFFPKREYNTFALRLIISVFPYMMKYKGSKKGIEIALNTILKAEKNYGKSIIRVQDNVIAVFTEYAIKDEMLLRDVLSYVLPIGYELTIDLYKPYNVPGTTQTFIVDTPLQIISKTTEISHVVNHSDIEEGNIDFLSDPTDEDNVPKNIKGSYVVGEVVATTDLEESE